jgi:hypothetical protein
LTPVAASEEFHYVNAVADTKDAGIQLYDSVQNKFSSSLEATESSANSLIQSAFTPGNSQFSGYLPCLETRSEKLWNLYHLGVRNLLFARRISPDSVYGRT